MGLGASDPRKVAQVSCRLGCGAAAGHRDGEGGALGTGVQRFRGGGHCLPAGGSIGQLEGEAVGITEKIVMARLSASA